MKTTDDKWIIPGWERIPEKNSTDWTCGDCGDTDYCVEWAGPDGEYRCATCYVFLFLVPHLIKRIETLESVSWYVHRHADKRKARDTGPVAPY